MPNGRYEQHEPSHDRRPHEDGLARDVVRLGRPPTRRQWSLLARRAPPIGIVKRVGAGGGVALVRMGVV